MSIETFMNMKNIYSECDILEDDTFIGDSISYPFLKWQTLSVAYNFSAFAG